MAATYGMLAAALVNSGDEDAARAVIAQGESVETIYAWERPLFERVKQSLQQE